MYLCFVLALDIILLDLYIWMFFFINGNGVHGLRVCLVDSRIEYAKVVSLELLGPWSRILIVCGKLELLPLVNLKLIVSYCYNHVRFHSFLTFYIFCMSGTWILDYCMLYLELDSYLPRSRPNHLGRTKASFRVVIFLFIG